MQPVQRSAQFYFSNLGADIMRCISAAQARDRNRYAESYKRAENTLAQLRSAGRPEAYAEGKLALLGLDIACESDTLDRYKEQLNRIITVHVR